MWTHHFFAAVVISTTPFPTVAVNEGDGHLEVCSEITFLNPGTTITGSSVSTQDSMRIGIL